MNRVHATVLRLKKFAGVAIRGCFSADLVISLIGLAEFVALIWYFNLVGNFRDNLMISLVYAVLPVLFYKTPPRKGSWYRTLNYWNLGLTVCLFLALLMMMGQNLNVPWLGFNAAMMILALPFLFILVRIFLSKPFLGLAIVPTLILALCSLVVEILPADSKIDYFFLPIPFLLPLCIGWALMSRRLLNLAQVRRSYAVQGYLFEFLMMVFLFVPFIVLVLVATRIMSEDPVWMAVSATILGVLFSGIIAEPLRKLLLELAELTQTGEN